MGKIYYVMGKSSSGKDTVYQELLDRAETDLEKIVLYTTRPIRAKEKNGVEYYFITDQELDALEKQGKVIECREYHTMEGIWRYATVDNGNLQLEKKNYLAIGTLVSYEKLKGYFGEEKLIPIYIEVHDDLRLERAIRRERKQTNPNYEEICRRFLADAEDFSEEKLKRAGIRERFSNNGDREECIEEISGFLLAHCSGLQ